VSLFNKAAQELLALRAASVSNAETIRQLRAEIESPKEQVAQLQTIIREEATDSGNVILELATANETIAALKEQIAQLEREFKIEFGDLHDSYIEQKETIAEQADELSESQKHINHLRMALADAEALELGTCERLAKARSMLAEQAEAIKQLREWIEKWCKFDSLNMDLQEWFKFSAEYRSLSIQPNPDILRERDARLVERIADLVDSFYPRASLIEIADKIRKGEFN